MAEEREEGGYRKGLVAVGYDFEVDRMPVEPERKEGGDCVNGYHKEYADDAVEGSAAEKRHAGHNILSLLPWLRIM